MSVFWKILHTYLMDEPFFIIPSYMWLHWKHIWYQLKNLRVLDTQMIWKIDLTLPPPSRSAQTPPPPSSPRFAQTYNTVKTDHLFLFLSITYIFKVKIKFLLFKNSHPLYESRNTPDRDAVKYLKWSFLQKWLPSWK